MPLIISNDLKIPSLKIFNGNSFLSQLGNAAKNVQYFSGLLYFSKFDKCDAIPHLHKVTGKK